MTKRVAIGGFMLESNGHAPVATRAEFLDNVHLVGDAITADLARPNPTAPMSLQGFAAAMDASGPWEPVPTVMSAVGASGPVDQAFFDEVMDEMRRRLQAALPLDGVFLSQHGAATATAEVDPDGRMFALVRDIVGPDVPVIATLDLHGNVSDLMVRSTDLLISYRCNPHTDMAERGAEAAAAMRLMFAGMRPKAALVKLPLIPPSVTQNTKAGPYADLIDHGQSKLGGGILNVSILSGFTLGDTPKNGMSVIVTAEADQARADATARELATWAWARRHQYVPALTSLDEATRLAVAVGRDPAQPSLLFADVADNPGGGGRGNTTWILEAFYEAGAEGVLVGIFNDPALAAEAHALGVGARFLARFNRDETQPLSRPFEAPGEVVALADGTVVGRRGMNAGRTVALGKTALIRCGGIEVAVVTVRAQLHEPAFVEHLGVDLRRVRSLVVKSRGHFRAAFDDLFSDDRIIEVDVPGLTTPVLSSFPFRQVPRPIFPLDKEMEWQAP